MTCSCDKGSSLNALVTGAAGFIGSRICARLVEDGHNVVGFDDLSDGSRENLTDVPQADLIVADLRDEGAVRSAASDIEVIFHHGAMRSVPRSMHQPVQTTEVNVMGTLNVLRAAVDADARVVFASSSSVYGIQSRFPLSEAMTPAPQSPYAASKLAGEIYCQTWWRSFGVPTIALRYFNVYGPWQSSASQYAAVIPTFILACLGAESPVVYGDGEQARDFTFIDDVVTANIHAATAGEAAFGQAFNIGGGRRPTSVNRILVTVGELTGTRPVPRHQPAREGDVRLTDADISRARALLGYEPRTSVEEGLKTTVEWFGSRLNAASGQ